MAITMNVSDRLTETARKLEEQGAVGPFCFRMPVAVAQVLLAELEVTHVPAGNVFEWNGHKIVAQDRIEVLRVADEEAEAQAQAANE